MTATATTKPTEPPCACGQRPCLMHFGQMSQADRAKVQRSIRLRPVYPRDGR